MDSYRNIQLTIKDERADIVLNRPEKKNALSPELHTEMNEALEEIERDGTAKAVVVTGAGDSFCAGMDLEKCFFEPFEVPAEFERINDTAQRWFKKFQSFPVPTIAQVNGWCFGGGIEIVGMCDMAVAVDEAIFGLSEINFGTFPGGGTTWAVANNIPRKWAMYLILTGQHFTGKEATDIGLINFAVPRSDLATTVGGIVGSLKKKNRHTLRAAKEVYEGVLWKSFPEGINWEMAKLYELSYVSRDEWIGEGLGQFSRREYRPGLESYRLGKEDG